MKITCLRRTAAAILCVRQSRQRFFSLREQNILQMSKRQEVDEDWVLTKIAEFVNLKQKKDRSPHNPEFLIPRSQFH